MVGGKEERFVSVRVKTGYRHTAAFIVSTCKYLVGGRGLERCRLCFFFDLAVHKSPNFGEVV